MTLSTGARNRRVTIERESDIPNGQGGFNRTWGLLRKSWASATPVAGKESLLNGTLRASQPWRLELDAGDITVKDRVKMGTLILGIQSVADVDGRGATQVLFCETEQA